MASNNPLNEPRRPCMVPNIGSMLRYADTAIAHVRDIMNTPPIQPTEEEDHDPS